MAGGSTSDFDGDEEISGINVTPLVDVVLVLLIIFMITAPAIYQSAIKVQLPRAKTGDEAAKTPLSFTITKSGEILWGQENVDLETISKRLAEKPSPTDTNVMISADEATPHGTVIRLMDTLRQAGLTRFGLSVSTTKP